jgi:hypothetical protein
MAGICCEKYCDNLEPNLPLKLVKKLKFVDIAGGYMQLVMALLMMRRRSVQLTMVIIA